MHKKNGIIHVHHKCNKRLWLNTLKLHNIIIAYSHCIECNCNTLWQRVQRSHVSSSRRSWYSFLSEISRPVLCRTMTHLMKKKRLFRYIILVRATELQSCLVNSFLLIRFSSCIFFTWMRRAMKSWILSLGAMRLKTLARKKSSCK